MKGFSMYAIANDRGRCTSVEVGQNITVDRLDAEIGDEITMPVQLVAGGEGDVQIGTPLVEGVQVVSKSCSPRARR